MTTKEAEVTKTEAALNTAWDSHQDALADRAEEIKAAELPEVWELGDGHENGWHYKAGDTGATSWLSDLPEYHCRCARGGAGATQVTKAVYDNARAIYHGADFTGRLDQIDVPVCELNQATRDEMATHLWGEFESLSGRRYVGASNFDVALLASPDDIYRLRAPKTRPMTRKEVLAWAASADAFGWVVRCETEELRCPQQLVYDMAIRRYQRALIATLNDDGTGGTWEAFEVPAK